MLRRWYKEYLENGFVHTNYRKKSKFTEGPKDKAVSHCFNHGKCYARTIRMVGYPNRSTLREWCNEVSPSARKVRENNINYTRDQKEKAVLSLLQREEPAEKLANKIGVERETLYKWKNQLVGKESPCKMKPVDGKTADQNILKDDIYLLEKQISQLQLEKNLLEIAVSKLKKL